MDVEGILELAWYHTAYEGVARVARTAERLRISPTGTRLASLSETVGKVVSVVSIFSAAVLWIWEASGRAEQRHYAAWTLIAAAHGKPGEFGRVLALESLNRDRVSLSGIDLSFANLRGIELPQADLSGARFEKTNFHGANFQCGFSQLFLFGFWDPTRCGTNFKGALFDSTDLGDAKLWGGDMDEATFTGEFRDPKMHGVSLWHANFKDATVHCGDFSRAFFYGAKFTNTHFTTCKKLDRDLYEHDGHPDFDDALLTSVDLRETGIDPAWLKTAKLCDVWLPDGTHRVDGCHSD